MSRVNRKRILVVDDSPVVLAQLQDDLAGDYDVVLAESAEQAMEILEDPVRDELCFSDHFDLIITDLLMPGKSGLELAQYVRQRNRVNKYTPVIMLTTEKISKEEVRKSGCVAYFNKSDKLRLLAMVRILL